MNSVFFDTSALYALFSKADAMHREAVAILRSLQKSRASPVTTDLVIIESFVLVHARTGSRGLLKFRAAVDGSAWLQRVETSSSQHAEGWQLIERRTDQDYSFVDAVSFVVMRALRTTRAFTFDAHFAQEGFDILSA